MVVGGLDLAAYEHRCSGLAVIDEDLRAVKELVCLHSDKEIIDSIKEFLIEVLAIDAPIAEYPRFREVDREAIRRGFRIMSPTFKSMKVLTLRAWRLYQELRSLGVVVIETHPRSALKNSGVDDIINLCKILDISISKHIDKIKHKDLRDALISALVALCYKSKTCLEAIEAIDGTIYILTSLAD